MIVLVDDGFIVMVVQHPFFIYTENYPQWETSVMRVSFQRPHKNDYNAYIHENNVYLLAVMDQDADSVCVMTLNCLGHNNVYSQ